MTRTYYDILGVPASADQDAIDDAWRQRVKETHPDQNDDPNAAQQFLAVKEAYDVLSDPAERERYDQLGHDQYLDSGGATGGTDESTQNAYSTSDETSSTRAGGTTDDGVAWTAHTRGSEAAERVWSDSGGPTESPAESSGATDWARRLAAYAIVALPLGFASPILLSSLLGQFTEAEAPVASGPAVIALVVGVTLLFVAVVTAAEQLLDTDRRLLDDIPGI